MYHPIWRHSVYTPALVALNISNYATKTIQANIGKYHVCSDIYIWEICYNAVIVLNYYADSSNLVSDVSDHSNIVTVPEKIVTVNARSAESIDNGSEHNSSTSTANGLDPQSVSFKARLSKVSFR